jgi:hypothetical protein
MSGDGISALGSCVKLRAGYVLSSCAWRSDGR